MVPLWYQHRALTRIILKDRKEPENPPRLLASKRVDLITNLINQN